MQEGLRGRSFHSSAPATATTGTQGPPPPTSRSDRDDLRVSLDHFRKPVPPVGATASSHLLEEGACDRYTLPHPVWSDEELNSVQITHTLRNLLIRYYVTTHSLTLIYSCYLLLQAAYYSVQLLRTGFDVFSGYAWGKRFGTLDEKKWLSRIIYLETVAGVPGDCY